MQISLILWNACVALLNFKCSNPSRRRGNVTIKIHQKYQCIAWTDSRLACLSSSLYQHLVILYRPYPLSCQLYLVYLAVFLLSVLLDNYCIWAHEGRTWSLQKFLRVTKRGWNGYNLYIWQWQILLLTDIPPTVDRYTADNQWPAYRPCRPRYRLRYLPIVGRYVDDHSADITVDTSVD